MTIFWKQETSTKWHLCVEPAAKLLTLTKCTEDYLIECLGQKIRFQAESSKLAKKESIVRLKDMIKLLEPKLNEIYHEL